MAKLFAYTDGACSGNPGPGGWGALMQAVDDGKVVKERELKGGEANTTNNRMELLAAIHALEALERDTEITLVTESNYVKNGITGWIFGWNPAPAYGGAYDCLVCGVSVRRTSAPYENLSSILQISENL